MSHPLSEQFRIVAKQYVEADGAARLMEECKTATLEKRKADLLFEKDEKVADNALEREVKSSPEWREYLEEMCGLRTKANKYKLQLEYIRMKSMERAMANKYAAEEMRMMGSRNGDT